MKIYVSVGDINGIGLEILLRSHISLQKKYPHIEWIYGVDKEILAKGKELLNINIDIESLPCISIAMQNSQQLWEQTFNTALSNFLQPMPIPCIQPATICSKSGLYSLKSFLQGVLLAQKREISALITLPIHKQAWAGAGIHYAGHTELLRFLYQQSVIMMLGCPKLFVALFSDHIPLKQVPATIQKDKIVYFLIQLCSCLKHMRKCGVLGLNPHAGDGGLLGDEDFIIQEAIAEANAQLKCNIFSGPLVPDTAFTPFQRQQFSYFVAFYHDQGLIPLKTLYFDESINVSLGLPIIRVSVDHGVAFDKAYKQQDISCKSYENAIQTAILLQGQS
ncbi:hypothetical protein CCZ01_01180 [Helicobacter monodelphidis]|uniref:4-hydroxythreonine-4-phosphate dehydrogenase n=1 Tax=Helicobacter sp. 15-1451 TaxID=2004995 RepID=UPI000DCDCA5E|nr:4-hydroxythreonine-4-phosphate dehydrogenase [Helicobacter sp. 15-1451]RAX58837.1 hypothetical protein CCZ01_01180 [Helicobacter sp. 15-1451]